MLSTSGYRLAYGGVNLRATKLRELRMKSLNNYEPNKVNMKQNRRPCGWFRDTFIPVPKLKGENKAHKEFVNSVSLEIRKKIINEIKQGSPSLNLAESYMAISNMAEAVAPEPNEFVKERIRDIMNYRANFNILYNSNRGVQAQKLLNPVDMPHLHDAISELLYLSCESDNIKKEISLPTNDFVPFDMEHKEVDDTINPIYDIIKTPLLEFWSTIGCTKYVNYNGYSLPGRFEKSVYHEYQIIRTNMTFYDLGCEIVYKFTGIDKYQVVNQFISCKIPKNDCDVSYGCVINNNGHILDTAYIFYSKLEDTIYMVTSGYNRNIQSNFIAEYIIYCQRSGLDVMFHNEEYHTVALNGKECTRFFGNNNFNNFTHCNISNLSDNDRFDGLPEMPIVRISYTGNDGIHFICPTKFVSTLTK